MTATQKKRPAHSGFDVEPSVPQKVNPKGTTYKHNPDGTITPIYPKKQTSTTKKTGKK